ncbi:Protein kinase-like domain [Phytophthora cactorum]|nr:Protein kinase-like domain [Phytophthora cactorum]
MITVSKRKYSTPQLWKPYTNSANTCTMQLEHNWIKRTIVRATNVGKSDFTRLVDIYREMWKMKSRNGGRTHLQRLRAEPVVVGRTLIVDLSHPENVEEVREWVRGMLTALTYWQERGYCHGDVQWENIVYNPMAIDESLRFQHDLFQLGELFDDFDDHFLLTDELAAIREVLQASLRTSECTAASVLDTLNDPNTLISWGRVTSQQIVNHLQHSIILSQKDQLTQLLYTQEHGEQTQVDRCFPRTFDLSQSQDRRLLKIWFHYSQAVAVLKKSLNESVEVDEAQVGAAMKLIRAVIASDDFFECWRKEETLLSIDSGVEIVPLDCDRRRKVEEALGELELRDPQYHTVGSADSNVWICKPSNLSQGRGIVLCRSFKELEEITSINGEQDGQETGTERQSRTKWIVQKSYLRFCSRRFELTRLNDRFTHLSNYSVQQYFVSEEASDLDQKGYELTADHRDESLDQFEPMLSSEQFRDTLK